MFQQRRHLGSLCTDGINSEDLYRHNEVKVRVVDQRAQIAPCDCLSPCCFEVFQPPWLQLCNSRPHVTEARLCAQNTGATPEQRQQRARDRHWSFTLQNLESVLKTRGPLAPVNVSVQSVHLHNGRHGQPAGESFARLVCTGRDSSGK